MKIRLKPKFLIIVGIIILLIGGVFWLAKKSNLQTKIISESTASAYFEQAQKAELEGDLKTAEELYQKA
ncbi:MAG: hypothetical protein CEN91_178, partial [Candidatus Berkelbacteria bacterium Licking1014_85]